MNEPGQSRQGNLPISLYPRDIRPAPEETRRVAQAAFPRGNVDIRMRDELGAIDNDQLFALLFPARGQPAVAVPCSALYPVMATLASPHEW
jgi:transposase